MSLEELGNVEVTTVARKEETAFRVPAAVYVISAEEIRRSGARNLPEALRLAPGLHVSKFNNGTWAISARGFNITTANKMQILLDGRSLYSPLFSGVFWDVQEVMMENIERIEVVRGPNAVLWGANAINGVINIITKTAADTQGNMAVFGGGMGERGFANFRHGGTAAGASYRVYGRYFYRDPLRLQDGSSAKDDFRGEQAGFRSDFQASPNDQVMVQGDIYRSGMGLLGRDDISLHGGSLLARWTHRLRGGSELQFLSYFDRTSRFIPLQHDETRNTYDLQLQHHVALSDRHDMVWGGEYRASTDHTETTPLLFFDPDGRMIRLLSLFAEDEVTVVPTRLNLSFGIQAENNTYTGWEIQPTLRLAYTPSSTQTAWAAVSRAVRTPTRFDTDLRVLVGRPVPLIVGSRTFKSEELLAYEGGYRVQPNDRVMLDAAVFWNDYDHLRSQDINSRAPLPIVLGNTMEARTYGAELTATYQVRPAWRLFGTWTNLQEQLRPSAVDFSRGLSEANDPRNRFQFRSNAGLPHRLELDLAVRYAGRLPNGGVGSHAVGDFRLGWRARSGFDVSLVARDLGPKHRELGPSGTPEFLRPSVYGIIRWAF